MGRKSTSDTPSKAGDTRKDRLKSALKANLQRRKSQARARKTSDSSDEAEK